jgi:hypothetical protein
LQTLENLHGARLSTPVLTFSLGEKFIEDCPETQFFTSQAACDHRREPYCLIDVQVPTQKKPEDNVSSGLCFGTEAAS